MRDKRKKIRNLFAIRFATTITGYMSISALKLAITTYAACFFHNGVVNDGAGTGFA